MKLTHALIVEVETRAVEAAKKDLAFTGFINTLPERIRQNVRNAIIVTAESAANRTARYMVNKVLKDGPQ